MGGTYGRGQGLEGEVARGFESLEPVNQETTAGAIAGQIRARIMDGTFPAGSQLGEVQLANRLNVSRGPIREALQRLIQEGLLENKRNRGVFVVSLGYEDVADVYLARRAVERAAAELLILNADEEVFDRLEESVRDMSIEAERGRWKELADADLRFHELMVRSSGSKRLRRMFGTLLAETSVCIAQLESAYPVRARLVEEHSDLLGALRRGNEEKALRLIDAHLEDAVADLTNAKNRGSARRRTTAHD